MTGPASRGRAVSSAVGVYVLVLVVLQVFLLTVAVDAMLGDDPDSRGWRQAAQPCSPPAPRCSPVT